MGNGRQPSTSGASLGPDDVDHWMTAPTEIVRYLIHSKDRWTDLCIGSGGNTQANNLLLLDMDST